MAQPGETVADGFQDIGCAVAVLDIGFMDNHEQHQTERISDDVALAALDLLAGVVARNPATFGGLDALAVDDAGRGRGLTPLQFARSADKQMIDGLPKADIAPAIEIASHRGDRWKVLRQSSPLTAAARNIKDRVHHFPHIRFPWPPAGLGRR